jgi:hypothetical protein
MVGQSTFSPLRTPSVTEKNAIFSCCSFSSILYFVSHKERPFTPPISLLYIFLASNILRFLSFTSLQTIFHLKEDEASREEKTSIDDDYAIMTFEICPR